MQRRRRRWLILSDATDWIPTDVSKNPDLESRLPKESVIIASLLHDVCKLDIYKETMKKQKNMEGQWEEVKGYDVDHGQYPFGHGEKSVILLLQNGLKLTNDEALAIRWHMHAWDLPMQSYDAKGNFNKAKEICPMVQLLIAADGLASQVLECKWKWGTISPFSLLKVFKVSHNPFIIVISMIVP